VLVRAGPVKKTCKTVDLRETGEVLTNRGLELRGGFRSSARRFQRGVGGRPDRRQSHAAGARPKPERRAGCGHGHGPRGWCIRVRW
jgi:hypothetical protein